jgi:hypothetical protein
MKLSLYKCFLIIFNLLDISKEMAIDSSDIVSTLQALGMMKYWKGKHIILKKQVLSFTINLVNLYYCYMHLNPIYIQTNNLCFEKQKLKNTLHTY